MSILWEGTPMQSVYQNGPDWPEWYRYEDDATIVTRDCEIAEGSLYITRVEGQIYGVLWRRFSSPRIIILKYDPGHRFPREIIGTEEVTPETMKAYMDNLPSYLVRWALDNPH